MKNDFPKVIKGTNQKNKMIIKFIRIFSIISIDKFVRIQKNPF